jgi:hypothetical protein
LTSHVSSDAVTERDVRPASPPPGRPTRRVDPATLVFALVLLGAFFFYLVLARRIWFFRDDWEFLAGRELTVDDLLRQHGGHLTALHVLVYRVMFYVFGLRSYVPYQLLSIGLHLTLAALLYAVMRKADVASWIAAAGASLFALFGTGGQDILWGFQIEFTGAVVLGLTQTLLASHDGPINRRDWLGLLAGFLALMCTSVAITMVGVAGLATLIRRNWRAAAFHVVPLAAAWVAWWLKYGTDSSTADELSQVVQWVRRGVVGVFDGLGQLPLVGVLLAVMLVVGFVLAWLDTDPAERRRRLAVPTAMLAGSLGFIVLTGVNRASFGVRFATSSRYLHIAAALLIPALGVAAAAIFRRWRVLGPVVVALLLVGIPGNLDATSDNFAPERYFDAYEHTFRTLPRMDLAKEVPRDVRPELVNAPWVTVGWLRDMARQGRIPRPERPSTPQETATHELRLSLQQLDEADPSGCEALPAPVERELDVGDELAVRGTVRIQLVDDETGVMSTPVTYGASFLTGAGPHTLRAVAGPMTVRIAAVNPLTQLCG